MEKTETTTAVKSGRGFNGAHRDSGSIVHIVPKMSATCSGFWGDKALCGTRPGYRGNGWSEVHNKANCPKCLSKQLTLEINDMQTLSLTSPALKWQSNRGGRFDYPAKYRGRVPLKVIVAKNITPDLMEFKKELGIKEDTICLKDHEYYVWVNSYGAVSAILHNGEKLGLLPSEFDVTEWHPNEKK